LDEKEIAEVDMYNLDIINNPGNLTTTYKRLDFSLIVNLCHPGNSLVNNEILLHPKE
jgi:hypothetical protein